jgi:hypothetical protein
MMNMLVVLEIGKLVTYLLNFQLNKLISYEISGKILSTHPLG